LAARRLSWAFGDQILSDDDHGQDLAHVDADNLVGADEWACGDRQQRFRTRQSAT